MSTASYTQVAARFRNDNGSETTATWRQNQNTNDTITLDTPFRVRFLIDETASVAWTSVVWQVRTSKNGAAYTVDTACAITSSPNFADGDNCTSQLTGGSGTFVVANAGMNELGNITNSGTAGQFFETETCFVLSSSGGAVVGDTYDFRIYNQTLGAAIAAYTFTPRMTAIAAPSTPKNIRSILQPILAQ